MGNQTLFTLVVPLNEANRQTAQNENSQSSLRCMVWSTAAERLKALLGKTCSLFSPAFSSYGISLPYGVALGAVEAKDFLLWYVTARKAQENELEARKQRILSKGNVLLTEQISDKLSIQCLAFQHDDPELLQELELANRFICNDITATACLYYLGIEKCCISKKEEQDILSHLGNYAICVAKLKPLEVGECQ